MDVQLRVTGRGCVSCGLRLQRVLLFRVDWREGSRWGNLRSQGQALVHHGLPLPPLALPLTIPGFDIGTELVGEGASSRRLQRPIPPPTPPPPPRPADTSASPLTSSFVQNTPQLPSPPFQPVSVSMDALLLWLSLLLLLLSFFLTCWWCWWWWWQWRRRRRRRRRRRCDLVHCPLEQYSCQGTPIPPPTQPVRPASKRFAQTLAHAHMSSFRCIHALTITQHTNKHPHTCE